MDFSKFSKYILSFFVRESFSDEEAQFKFRKFGKIQLFTISSLNFEYLLNMFPRISIFFLIVIINDNTFIALGLVLHLMLRYFNEDFLCGWHQRPDEIRIFIVSVILWTPRSYNSFQSIDRSSHLKCFHILNMLNC